MSSCRIATGALLVAARTWLVLPASLAGGIVLQRLWPGDFDYDPNALIRPNGHADGFLGQHVVYGLPKALWAYRDRGGEILFFNALYATSEGEVCTPWRFDGREWIAAALFSFKQGLVNSIGEKVVTALGERCVFILVAGSFKLDNFVVKRLLRRLRLLAMTQLYDVEKTDH